MVLELSGFAGGCLECPGEFYHSVELGEPTLRRVLARVQVTLRRNVITAFGKCQRPTPWDTVFRLTHVFSQLGDVDERCVPAALDMRFLSIVPDGELWVCAPSHRSTRPGDVCKKFSNAPESGLLSTQ